MPMDIRGLRIRNTSLVEPVIELARITYRSSGISLYIPKSVVNALKLDPERHSSLIMFNVGGNCFFLIKDTELARLLKPKILDMCKSMHEIKDDR